MSVVRLIYARQNARSWRGNLEEARYRPHIQKVYGVVGYMDKKTVPCTESEEFLEREDSVLREHMEEPLTHRGSDIKQT